MSKPDALLGIDLGTSNLKVALFSPQGEILGQASRPSSCLPSPAGQTEQLPETWWENLCAALRELWSNGHASAHAIAGIGLCGFHHCPVFLREDGTSARPVIILHDDRLVASREELRRNGVLGRIESLTRSMVSAGHFPPIFHWVASRDPAGLKDTRWIMLAKDYLRYKLTGKIGTELCDATGTNLIEPGEDSWSEQLCGLLAIPPGRLPAVQASTDRAGAITPAASAATGLIAGTPVVFGGGDSHCALLGMGCIQEGDTGLLLGTNSTLRAVFDGFVAHPQARVWGQHHVVPDRYTVSASSMAGASVIHWLTQLLNEGGSDLSRQDQPRLEQLAAAVGPGCEGLRFLPYIHGERVPFDNPDATGAFLGIRHRHQREHFFRSALEGTALNIANCYDLIRECAANRGTVFKPPRLAGGGSHLALWHQIIADCLNLPIQKMRVQEAGTLGAALLAGVGLGIYADFPAAVAAAVRLDCVIPPTPANHQVYQEIRMRLNDDYRRLR